MAELDDSEWDEELVLDSEEYLCIPENPRLATLPPHPQPIPVIPPPQPNQGLPDTLPKQLNQVEMAPKLELMELDILHDTPDLIDIPKDIVSDFEAWVHDVLSYHL